MPVAYPISPEAESQWGDWRRILMGALNQAMQFSPQTPTQQSLPELLAGMAIEPTMGEALQGGMMGMGPVPLLTYPEFTKQAEKNLLNKVKDSFDRYGADWKYIQKYKKYWLDEEDWHSKNKLRNLIEFDLPKSRKPLQENIVDYGKLMSAIKDLEKKLPESQIFTEPIKSIITPTYYSGDPWNVGNPYAYFNPTSKEMALITSRLREENPSKIASAILHEGVHGLQYAEPGVGKELYNVNMDRLIQPYFNTTDYFNYFKKTHPYQNWEYWSKPEEMQAHGVANLLTKKLYPEHEYFMPYPETYNKYFMDTIDYLLSKGK